MGQADANESYGLLDRALSEMNNGRVIVQLSLSELLLIVRRAVLGPYQPDPPPRLSAPHSPQVQPR